jgi:outer membrane protein
MRFLKYLSLILSVYALCAAAVFAQQTTTISLNQAISNAVEKNIAIQKLQNNIDIQAGNIHMKYGNLFPTLSLSAGWQRTNSVQANQNRQVFNPITQTYENFNTSNNTTNYNYNLSLRSDILLFNGMSNYESVDIAKMQQHINYVELEKTKQDIALRVLADYIIILRDQQALKINEASLENARTQLESIKLFVEAGKKTMSDVYKQDVQVAQFELAVEQAKNTVNKSFEDLIFDSKLPQDKQYTITGTEFKSDLSLAEVQAYVLQNSNPAPLINTAISKRQDVKSAEQTINLSESNVELTRNALLFPTISGFGVYGLNSPSFSELHNYRNLTVGLNISYPIFQGFSLSVQKQQAQINLKGAGEDLTQLRTQITTDINKAVLDLKSLAKQIEISDRTIKAAEQDVFQATESFRVGLSTLLDVQTAQTNYNNALIDRSDLIYRFQFAQKQLEYYQGLQTY